MINISEILDNLDEFNDSYEDIYNNALHNLSDEESEKLTVKEFLLQLLNKEESEFT